MMNYGFGSQLMGGFGILGLITWIVLVVDLVLLGMWLWKHLDRK